MAILLSNPNNQQQTAVNDRSSLNTVNNNSQPGRRRHFTTINRLPDSTIQEEEVPSLLNESISNQLPNNNNQSTQSSANNSICCCCKSQITFCSLHYHYRRLPDLIVQHQPALIMSADVNFEQQHHSTINSQQIPTDNLASKFELVYTPRWIENDVFLPGPIINQSYNMSQFNQVNNLLNNQQVNQGNKQNNQQQNQSNKLGPCSPRINIRCQLNSAFYQCDPRLKAKILLNNARRSASVSLPIDHETLRQVGYSLRMISEQFHLQRLQANAIMEKNQRSSNLSYLLKSFCKFLVNKLPSISWKSSSNEPNSESREITNKINSKSSSPIKINKLNINQLNNDQLNRNHLGSNQLNNNQLIDQLDQPDVVPNVIHVIIPVRQRCRSTTTDC